MNDEADPEGHMGIRNVARRLRLLYGAEASMRIETDAGGQTLAAITVPLERPEEITENGRERNA